MGKGWYQQDISVVLVVVMCVFIVCQTPTFIDHVLWTVVDEQARRCGYWHYYYTAISDALAILNSSVNFVIYVLTSRNFRHGLVIHQSFGASSRSDYIGLQCSRVGGSGGGAGAALAGAHGNIQKLTFLTASNPNTALTLRLSDQNIANSATGVTGVINSAVAGVNGPNCGTGGVRHINQSLNIDIYHGSR